MQAFWLDEDLDREHAPDGRSRYGGEVRRRAPQFADAYGDIAPVSFAVTVAGGTGRRSSASMLTRPSRI